jgi:hypothetical protein
MSARYNGTLTDGSEKNLAGDTMATGNGQAGDWVNLYGNDGKVKARLNRCTMELVIKERRDYHTWRLSAMLTIKDVAATENPIEIALST